jgi:hypothetical protein
VDHTLQPSLCRELEHLIQERTGRRVRNLTLEVHPGRVVLRGTAASYYVKQLAQHAVRDVLAEARIDNAIAVESAL